VKEILLEAAHNKQRASEMGASGWYVCTLRWTLAVVNIMHLLLSYICTAWLQVYSNDLCCTLFLLALSTLTLTFTLDRTAVLVSTRWTVNTSSMSCAVNFVQLHTTSVVHEHLGLLQYHCWLQFVKQEVKVIWQKAPHGGPIPRLGVTPGGQKLYHWIPGVGFPISVP